MPFFSDRTLSLAGEADLDDGGESEEYYVSIAESWTRNVPTDRNEGHNEGGDGEN